MNTPLNTALTLPCGAIIPNRIGKAAMTEGLATAKGAPTAELERLYSLWSAGGAGLLLSGNIQIDSNHLERPGNVVIEGVISDEKLAQLRSWTQAATQHGNHFWAQLSHAGRQTPKIVNASPKAPSAVKVGLPGGQFGQPQALSIEEIKALTQRFADSAKTCQLAGFTGIQIHAAHGYLLSSFLSPKTNLRSDQYGGSLENRAAFLLEVTHACRAAVGSNFPIAVKINSADFQRGGFAFADSLRVAQWLSDAGVDLLEISGGNYEQPKLLGIDGLEKPENQNVPPSTAAREAYFVDFALAMQEKVKIPLMVTGGFRTRDAMEQALESGAADMIGLGRPLCTLPDGPRKLFADLDTLPSPENSLHLIPSWLGFLRKIQMLKAVDGFAIQYWFYGQIYALARSGNINNKLTPLQAVREVSRMEKKLTRQSTS